MNDMHGMAKQQVLQELMDMMDKMSASKLKGPAKMEVDMMAVPKDAADKPVDLMSALKDAASKSDDDASVEGSPLEESKESPLEEKKEEDVEAGQEVKSPLHQEGHSEEEDPQLLEELLRKYESLGK